MSNEVRPPETTAPRTKSNCLMAAGITCLVLVIVGVLVLLWIIRMVGTNPTFKQAFSGAKMVAECQFHLQNPNNPQNISAALERYRTRNGRYPDKLEDLCPDFLENRAILHCPADSRPTDVVSYEYTKPAPDAPGSTVVVECNRHILIEGQPPHVLSLTKDGRILKPNFMSHTSPMETKSKTDD